MLSLLLVVKDPINFHHWLRWHSMIAEEILIYDHNSDNPEPSRGNIRVFHHKDCQVSKDPEHGLQSNVYSFLLKQAKAEFVLPIDDDEYVLGDIHKLIRELQPWYGGIKLCRKTFGPNGHVNTYDINPLTHYKFYTNWDYGTKTISRVEAINRIDTHDSFLSGSYLTLNSAMDPVDQNSLHLTRRGELLPPCYDNVWINHYRYLSYSDIIRKARRGSMEFARSGGFYNKTLDEIYQLTSYESQEALVKTCHPTGLCYYNSQGILINQEFNVD